MVTLHKSQPVNEVVTPDSRSLWNLHIPVRSGNVSVKDLLEECEDKELKDEIEALTKSEERFLEAARRIPTHCGVM